MINCVGPFLLPHSEREGRSEVLIDSSGSGYEAKAASKVMIRFMLFHLTLNAVHPLATGSCTNSAPAQT